jgi:hypothetical protein
VPETHTVGRHYWVLHRYPRIRTDRRLPIAESPAVTRETEPPYRTGEGRIVRLWPTRRAVVWGRWREAAAPEDDTVAAAIQRREMELSVEEIRQWAD